MLWQKINVITTAQYAENIGEVLSAAGALAVTFEDAADQPIFETLKETPLWKKTIVCGLFAAEVKIAEICYLLKQQKTILSFHIEKIPDKNWIQETQKNFPSLKFGKRLWIVPSWEKNIEKTNSAIVILDPGVAFGTGTHETTQLCLEWLEKNVKKHDHIIDYGCGSGILSIAAIKLGAELVLAIDHDEQALAATRNNAKRNKISSKQLITSIPEKIPSWQADTLVANILATPLISLAHDFSKLIKPQGKIVLSGILGEQVENIINHYKPWFKMFPPTFKNEWARLEGIHNS